MSEENLALENSRLKRDNGFYRSIARLLVVAVIVSIFAMIYIYTTQKVILIPQGASFTKQASVGTPEVDDNYLQPIVDSILLRSMHHTPDTVAKNFESVLYLASPEFYSKFKTELTAQANYIKSNNITTTFFESRRDYRVSRNTIVVYGVVQKSIGQNHAPIEDGVVEISYLINGGRFELTGLQVWAKKDFQVELERRKQK